MQGEDQGQRCVSGATPFFFNDQTFHHATAIIAALCHRDDRSGAHAGADAHGDHAVPLARALELVHQRRNLDRQREQSAATWRAPVQPSGWPRAMAPPGRLERLAWGVPLGLTLAIGMPSFSTQ